MLQPQRPFDRVKGLLKTASTRMFYFLKRAGKLVGLFLVGLSTLVTSAGAARQDTALTQPSWFIALPLRFTQIQDAPTMLSGVAIGRPMSDRLRLSAVVYHSFYIKSFRPEANIAAFGNEQPRHFIYSAGLQTDYQLTKHGRWSSWVQGYLGWGYAKYQLEAHDFQSSSAHHVATEAHYTWEYTTRKSSHIGVGIGYRPFLGKPEIAYQSQVAQGIIDIPRNLPNGLILMLTFRGDF